MEYHFCYFDSVVSKLCILGDNSVDVEVDFDVDPMIPWKERIVDIVVAAVVVKCGGVAVDDDYHDALDGWNCDSLHRDRSSVVPILQAASAASDYESEVAVAGTPDWMECDLCLVCEISS